MSLRPEIRARARGDTVRQFRYYLRHGGIEVADGFVQAVDAEILRLCERPRLGVRCHFLGNQLQGCFYIPLARPYDVFVLFYRFDATSLLVLRVLHSSLDIPRLRLREEPAVYAGVPAGTVTATP